MHIKNQLGILLLLIAILSFNFTARAGGDKTILKNIAYYPETSELNDHKQCRLDIYHSEETMNAPALVWFHSGGLSMGDKIYFPKELKEQDFTLISVNYRLSPEVNAKKCIDDAAAALAWVFSNCEKYSIDRGKIFIGGHSAGGYLAGMIGLNPNILQNSNLSNMELAGIILVSGQVTTHFRIKSDNGDTTNAYLPRIDEFSVINFAAQRIPNLRLVVGDRRIEWKCRAEENHLLYATLQALGAWNCDIYELAGEDHKTVAAASVPYIVDFINKHLSAPKNIISLSAQNLASTKGIQVIAKEQDVFTGIAQTQDPIIFTKLPEPIDTKIFHRLQFEMKVQPNAGSNNWNLGDSGEIFWTTDIEPTFSGQRRLTFPLVCDDNWFVYQIDLTTSPQYKGSILKLRIDPVQNCKMEVHFSIRNICLVGDE